MNEARRAFPLQDIKAGFVRESGWYHDNYRPSQYAGDVFLRRENDERETEVLHHNADLLSER